MSFHRHLPLLLGLMLAGCATAPVRTDAPAPASNPFLALRRGMKPEEVKTLVGEPLAVRSREPGPAGAAAPPAETWTYQRKVSEIVQQVATSTKDVPYFDPFLNTIRMIKEPVYQNETVTVLDTIELLMIDGLLREWKITRRTERKFD
jgi:hypothetical protein